jgi:hypothetical protein
MTAKKTTAKKPANKPATSGFDQRYVDQVRAAEAAAQRSVINVPDGDTPDALLEALERRVEVNLAQADGSAVVRVGGSDPKVRDLESPYSKRKPPASA